MPRRRRVRRTRARTRRSVRSPIRRSTRRSSGKMKIGKSIVTGLGYGVVRQPISDGLRRILPNNFLSQIGDEVLLGGLAAAYTKFAKGSKKIKEITDDVVVVESARLGANLSQGAFNLAGIFGGNSPATTGGAQPFATAI